MRMSNGLASSLNKYFDWNKARMTCFCQMLLGLFVVRTVNLQQIALASESPALVNSRYRRFQRFFAQFAIDYTAIARFILGLFYERGKKYYLTIDRTNWYFGKNKINAFVLAIVYEGMAIPLFWMMLPKAGSTNFSEQKQLIEQFVDTFGRTAIAGILADREFQNSLFFGWLNKEKIPFFIRIKESSMVRIRRKKLLSAKKIFTDLQVKQQSQFMMTVHVFKQKVYLSGSRSDRGELMIVASNQKTKYAIANYLMRWEIETLFGCLKTRGFSFEDTHLYHPERISKLLALLAIGAAWAHKVGEWFSEKKPIRWVKCGLQRRPYYSFFRYGLDFIRDTIFHISYQFSQLKQCFFLLKPSLLSPQI